MRSITGPGWRWRSCSSAGPSWAFGAACHSGQLNRRLGQKSGTPFGGGTGCRAAEAASVGGLVIRRWGFYYAAVTILSPAGAAVPSCKDSLPPIYSLLTRTVAAAGQASPGGITRDSFSLRQVLRRLRRMLDDCGVAMYVHDIAVGAPELHAENMAAWSDVRENNVV